MDYAKHIADLQHTRSEKSKRMKEIHELAAAEGRTKDEAEAEEFKSLETEIRQLDVEISDSVRLKAIDDVDKATAKPVEKTARDNARQPVQQGVGLAPVSVKDTTKLDAGIAFARLARCKALAHIDHVSAADVAKAIYPGDEALHGALVVERSAVPAANTGVPTFGGNLILEGSAVFADFVEYLRPRTLLGQVAGRLRNLPFDTPVLVQTTAGAAKWVAEGAAKPLTSWQWTKTKMDPLKVAVIAAATKEQLRRASVAADALLRDELARAVADRLNIDFIDPSKTAVSGESPASILNGVSALPASGVGDFESVKCDIGTMMRAMTDANLSLGGSFWVMPESIAVALSLMQNPLGQAAFPGMTVNGGSLAGLPVFTSNYVDTDTSGSVVALVKGDEIFLGDEGGITVSMSDQASLLMDNAPSMDSTTPTAAQMVSLWQTNSVAFLVERIINWQRRRTESVAWMRVNWSECATVTGP